MSNAHYIQGLGLDSLQGSVEEDMVSAHKQLKIFFLASCQQRRLSSYMILPARCKYKPPDEAGYILLPVGFPLPRGNRAHGKCSIYIVK